MWHARNTRRRCTAAIPAGLAGGRSAPAAWAEPPTAYDRFLDNVDAAALDFEGAPRGNPFQPLVGPGSSPVTPAGVSAPRLPAPEPAAPDVQEPQIRDLNSRRGGILTNSGAPWALVHGQVLGVGESIEEGGIITAIPAGAVVFTYEGRSATLPIGEE